MDQIGRCGSPYRADQFDLDQGRCDPGAVGLLVEPRCGQTGVGNRELRSFLTALVRSGVIGPLAKVAGWMGVAAAVMLVIAWVDVR